MMTIKRTTFTKRLLQNSYCRTTNPTRIILLPLSKQNELKKYSTTRLLCSTSRNNDINNDNNNNNKSNDTPTKSYILNGIGQGTCVDITTNTGHILHTDIPKTMGGSDTAPQPVETLLAAWMGCTQATALFVGRQIMIQKINKQSSSSQQQQQQQQRLLISKLEFQNITAIRNEQGALQLPIDQTPSVVSRIQRVSGRIIVHATTKSNSRRQNRQNNRDNIIIEQQDTEDDFPIPKIIIDPDILNLLKEQTEIRCPVANMMIASGCIMDVEWIDASTLL